MSDTPPNRSTRPHDGPVACRTAMPAAAAVMLLTIVGCAAPSPEPDDRAAAPAETGSAPAPERAAATPDDRPGRDVVKPSHPVRYTVQRGDTLWDIAAKFLRDPWVWPEVWQVNPQIGNPHLIYPGDVITLGWVGGEPRLRVERPAAGDREVERLEPRVRESPLDEAIPSIPADAIRQFLNRPRVATREQIDDAPYVLGNYEGRLISAAGNDVFAKGFPGEQPTASHYNVYRPGEPLRDPGTGELLGYDIIYAGKAAVRDPGPPARLRLTDSTREILSGDRLMPTGRDLPQARYIPHAPEQEVDGEIIQLFDAISQVAANQVVVVNVGEREGMEIGHVLGIDQSGGTVNDPHVESGEDARVELPSQRVGTVMLFKVFDRVGYGLVLDATRAIHLGDAVTRP